MLEEWEGIEIPNYIVRHRCHGVFCCKAAPKIRREYYTGYLHFIVTKEYIFY